MKKGIRITIDGASNTGKTLLAYAFSEFLRQNGAEDEQISFFNDGMPPREECQRILENAIANGVFKDTEFVFVERNVGRLHLVDAGIEGTARWQAKPKKYLPIHQNAAHVDMEMGVAYSSSRDNAQRARQEDDKPVGTLLSTHLDASAVRRKYAKQHMLDMQNKSSEAQEYLQLQEIKRQTLLNEMLKEPALVPILGEFRINTVHLIPPLAQESYLGYRKREFEDNDTLPQLDVFISRWDRQPVTQQDMVRLYTAFKPGFPEICLNRKLQNSGISGAHVSGSTPLFNLTAHSALARAGRDALQAMTSQQARASSPILETLDDITRNHFAVRATDARAFRPEGGWPGEFGGTVLGHPLGHDNGDHNGELESGFKYQMQIHPLTGETREQMLVRAQSFIRGMHIGGGEMAFDYSNLPVDLTFDNQCGVRWKTEAEMAQVQAEVDAVFEQAHDAPLSMSKEYYFDAFGGLRASYEAPGANGEFGRLLAQLHSAGHRELMQKFTLHSLVNLSNDEAQQQKWNHKRRNFIIRGTNRQFHEVKFLAEFKPADGVTNVTPYIGQLIEAMHQCRPEVLAYVTYPTGRWLEQDRKIVNQSELDQYPGIDGIDSTAEFASEEEQRRMTEGRSPIFSRLPRGMNRSITHIDDAGLWPGGVAPVASPADPVLKEQMDTVAANLLKVRDQ
jgi:hypothetical protein